MAESGFRLQYKRYLHDYEQEHDSLLSALASVIDLCSAEDGRLHSKGLPIALIGPDGATVGQDLLWDYGAAFEWGDDPEPFARRIRALLLREEGV